MKAAVAVCAIFFVVLMSGLEASPVQQERQRFPEQVYEPAVVVRGDRHRRVTCDLLSFETKWGSINHAACAAHCLAMLKGYRGGHCDANGVCICRK